MKTILILSNPFGYGPAGQTIKLIEDLKYFFEKNNQDVSIIFAGSSICYELIKTISGITIVNLNERDPEEIRNFIQTFEQKIDLTIGVQNKFLAPISKELSILSYFIDGIAWLWNNYPEEYMIADKIFWTDFPELENKKKPLKKIYIIGELTNSITPSSPKESFILVSLGGQQNPIREGLQENYLALTAKIFEAVSFRTDKKYIIATGKKASDYLSNITSSSLVEYISIDHPRMMSLLAKCESFITIGGQSSTFEAFASGVKTSFFLPSNLSQAVLQDVFTSGVSWGKYVKVPPVFFTGSEKYAIDFIENFSKESLESKIIFDQIVSDIIKNINTEERQYISLYEKVRKNGSHDIYQSILQDLI